MKALPFILWATWVSLAWTQTIPPLRPSVRGIFPHGAQRGTETEITIRGNNLQDASEISFATPHITAKIVEVRHNRILARVRVGPAAEPGRRDLRIIAPHGSTIAWFDVGTRPESREKEPNNDIDRAQPVEFPILVNGTVTNGDYDYFKFTARAGQSLIFDIAAQRNESPLDSVLSLLDENGVEIAYVDDYYWFKDPHLVHTFDKAGTYYLRIYGSGESGSDSADYRLIAGEMPHVDHAIPAGAKRGETSEIVLSGVNLGSVDGATLGDGLVGAELVSRGDRSAKLRIKIPPDAPPGLHWLHVNGATLPVPFIVSDLRHVLATTDIARRKQDPVPVSIPVAASGVIDTPDAGHYFGFAIDKPQKILLAVDALRLNNHLDPIVILYDESGKRIAYQDDPAVNSAKRPANVDPHLVVDLKPGRYTALVRDNSFRGHSSYAYRLVMKQAEPDFIAGTVGTDETLYRGRETSITIRVRRVEGWNKPIDVWAENLPKGVSGPAKVIVPVEPTHYKGTCGEDIVLDGTEVEFPLKVEEGAETGLRYIRFKARGVMDGRVAEHEVVPNYWWRSLQKIWGPSESRDLYATIFDLPKVVFQTPDRVTAARGKPGSIKVVITRLDGDDAPLEIHALNAPTGLTVEPVTVRSGGTLADVRFTAATDRPVSVVLEGRSGGKTLGKSHPVTIDTTARPAAAKAAIDEN